MVEQLDREVCNILYYVARKNMKKKMLGNYGKKVETRLRACRFKWGGVLQAALSNKAKMYLSQNYNFIVRFPSASSATDQPKFN